MMDIYLRYFIGLKLNMFRKKLQIINSFIKENISKIKLSKFIILLIWQSQNLLLLITIYFFRSIYWILELKLKISNSLDS